MARSWALVCLAIFAMMASAEAEPTYEPEALLLSINLDGSVFVEYSLKVDPQLPSVNVSLFGHMYEELLVLNENKTPLSYELADDKISVFTLGSSQIFIAYVTFDLVNKTGRVWSLSVQSPINFTVRVPKDATVVGLSDVPILIETRDGDHLFIMPAGRQEVAYIIGTPISRELAYFAIQDAEKTIEAIRARGISVKNAESLLKDAKLKYKREAYAEAEKLAADALDTALRMNSTAWQAESTIQEAQAAIDEAMAEGRLVGLDKARELLAEAKEKFKEGDYQLALDLATDSKNKAVKASSTPSLSISPYMLAGVGVAIAIVVSVLLTMKRGRAPLYVKERRPIDVSKLLEGKLHLHPEDREVVEYLGEAGGEAFESEIRNKFKLPKTSVWRMIKRLEREGLVEVKKVGGQNLIRLKERG